MPATLDEYTYTYDADGNVLTKTNATDAALSESYTYDAANRLPATSGGQAQINENPGRRAVAERGRPFRFSSFWTLRFASTRVRLAFIMPSAAWSGS